jgi:uncharacterized membrane protein
MLTFVPVLLAVGAGLIAGVFFAFSTFVMKALAQLPNEQGIAAMQRINVVVMNPMFLSLFVGTALIAGICGVGAVFSWGSHRSYLLLAAALFYVAGCFCVTVLFNVPRNERLARLQPESAEASTYWHVYLQEWTFWNHIRAIGASTAAAAAAFSLAN